MKRTSSGAFKHLLPGGKASLDRFRFLRVPGVKEGEKPPLQLDSASGPVVYWMSRDMRVRDNWAVIEAVGAARRANTTAHVVFCLQTRGFLGATLRAYDFLLKGLAEVEEDCAALGIGFELVSAAPGEGVPRVAKRLGAGLVICDMSPLREARAWYEEVQAGLEAECPEAIFAQVDAHNVVPVWVASDKLEHAARTIRPKITQHLPKFLVEFPDLDPMPVRAPRGPPIDWAALEASLGPAVDRTVGPVRWARPGTKAGLAHLEAFAARLEPYGEKRNDPTKNAHSRLSPWLHFGQISAQRVALTVKASAKGKSGKVSESLSSFLEELIVRKELADNHCWYQQAYATMEAAAPWARETLAKHSVDPRPYVYTRAQLEAAQTHDRLWNAAQRQLVKEGHMSGFLRMYWAKCILYWTATPEQALADTIYLNDRYSLDGRDPNGYVGIAWSILGTHDMGWTERAVFGKIRCMLYDGCKRKFNVAEFENKKFEGEK